MKAPRSPGGAARWAAAGLGVAAAAYAAYVAATWYRYGRPREPSRDEADPLLEALLPEYDVAERHHVRVKAPPDITLAAAADVDLLQSPIVRGLIRARELVLGARTEDQEARPRALVALMEALGWRVLAERPRQEIVLGAVTRPWMAKVVFRGLPADEFKRFREPGYVKIVWTLSADPVGRGESIFRTETRVATTDASARRKFRWYWARFSPGILIIRRVLLGQLRRAAERRQNQLVGRRMMTGRGARS
jgi:hypothetical protein